MTGAGHARWESAGATRFRAQLRSRQLDFQRCSNELEQVSRTLLNHATQVEINEAAAIKAALAIENAALDAAGSAVDVAAGVGTSAGSAISAVTHAGKGLLHDMNPLNALKSIG